MPARYARWLNLSNKPKGDVAESAYRNGLESLWLGNYDSAVGYFENAVNKNPKRADAWVKVGYCKVKRARTRKRFAPISSFTTEACRR